MKELFCAVVCSLHIYECTAKVSNLQKFSNVKIEIDGSADIQVGVDKSLIDQYKLDLEAKTGEFEKNVYVKDNVLHIVCTKKSPKLGLMFSLVLPDGIESVFMKANKAKIVVAAYQGSLAIDMYKMDLTVDSVLKNLVINADSLRVKLNNMAYDTKITAKKLSFDAVVTKCVKQKLGIDVNMCKCNIVVKKDAKVNYKTSGWMTCSSDFTSVDENEADVFLNIATRFGKTKLKKGE